MNKIGIITFHTSINYGVHLQAYALQTAIRNMGFQAEIINYSKKVEQKELRHYLSALFGIFKIIKLRKYRKTKGCISRKTKFLSFDRKYLYLSQKCENRDEVVALSESYHAIVCGSDQIWNPTHTHMNDIYFCKTISKKRRIAYAPSFGVESIPDRVKDKYKELLGEINFLSVRESSGARIIKELIDRDSPVVVDPTLLLSEDDWSQLIGNELNDYSLYKERKYVVCYFLGEHKKDIKKINDYYMQKNIVVLNISQHYNKKYSNVIDIYPGIEEFLYLIKNSLAVFTDSYHGTMFSVVYNRDFYSFKRNDTTVNLNTRIESFLTIINHQERFINHLTEKHLLNIGLNYEHINRLICEWKTKSLSFLRDSFLEIAKADGRLCREL